MTAAQNSQRLYERTKLLVVRDRGHGDNPLSFQHATVQNLAEFFEPSDLLVVNTSGTLPSSFRGWIRRSAEPIELRLAAFQGTDPTDFRFWKAISFGAGDWHTPTELRGAPARLEVGDRIHFSPNFFAKITNIDPSRPRLLEIEFNSEHLLKDLYQEGRPIQYSYLQEELHVWDQQTPLAGAPLSVEPPSSAFPLNWQILLSLQKKGVEIGSLLHSAGLSSTGDTGLDQRLPLEEYYEIPQQTLQQIRQTQGRGARIVALGTTVVRALESAFRDPQNIRAHGRTNLRLGEGVPLRVTDALLTGMHEPESSHAGLMTAFASSGKVLLQTLERETRGYRSHEYGDLTLLFRPKKARHESL
jgi:S-adenosylmethionine:tRNA ribosyltransferase-isomerase